MQPWRVLSYILFVLILIFHFGKLHSSVQRRIADRYRPKQSDQESRFDKGPLRLRLSEDVSLQPSRSAAVILLHRNIPRRRSRCIGDFLPAFIELLPEPLCASAPASSSFLRYGMLMLYCDSVYGCIAESCRNLSSLCLLFCQWKSTRTNRKEKKKEKRWQREPETMQREN